MKKILILLAFLLVFLPKISFGQTPNASNGIYSGRGTFDKNHNVVKISIAKNSTGLKELKNSNYYFVVSPSPTLPSKLSELQANKNFSIFAIGSKDVDIYSNTNDADILDYAFTVVPNFQTYYISIAQIDVTKIKVFNTTSFSGPTDSAIKYVLLPYIEIKGQTVSFIPVTINLTPEKTGFIIKGGVNISNTTGYTMWFKISDTEDFIKVVDYRNPKLTGGIFNTIIDFSNLTPGKDYYLKQYYYFPNNRIPIIDNNTYKLNTLFGAVLNNQNSTAATGQYKLLSKLDGFGLTDFYDPYSDVCKMPIKERPAGAFCSFNEFLNFLIKLGIGLAAVVLVLRIMMEGFKYITTDLPGVKISAKNNLTDAAVGLLIALTAYIILNTINPRLLTNTLELDKQVFNVSDFGDSNISTNINVSTGKMPAGVICPKTGKSASVANVANSFAGKVVYFLNGSPRDGKSSSGKDPSALTDGKARLDCSGFVVTVLACSGYKAGTDFINSGTADIFKNADPVDPAKITNTSINGIKLNPGDLLGWTGKDYGHVMIYIGDGKLIDSHRTPSDSKNIDRTTIGGINSFEVTGWAKNKIKFIKRIPK